MNTINHTSLFTDVTSDESASVNGGFGGLGGFDFQGQFYNSLVPFLPDPWIYPLQVQFFDNVVSWGSLDAFLQGGTTGQLDFLLGAARQVGGF
ncbi:MAG: hypothetical protein J0L70_27250 [Leptolyngbya sp. UWPOB_LEPTO1]|uniref:hypothetical protein n=1 Tax=Leptolyngbya sp. UWPOB_LEPTO1 TaxID=2815653 RepID=UPI001ACCD1FB|nr:hypothetical protein [Leptolyngbya sp. UWPOB_LEPTO1]MBN8564235.1 hypothetical protein [Leptolyngbya sp. UWPOB_LEPTO1]